VTNAIGMIIELLVTLLLMVTIGYCMLLNRRLKRLKSDEQSLRATISELVTATEIAERAIGGLKLTVQECEFGLGARLGNAERLSAELDRGIAAGKGVLDRLAQIVTAGGGNLEPERDRVAGGAGTVAQWQSALTAPRHDAQAVAAAAKAFAERLRAKVTGRAA
jgi:Domain of unknown function (DUF6468)